ncbi:MAG TPA: ribosome maturation factor RimP [Terriglobia bacterium]|nr:ribosome maturation factor RimP [Terriglobia bacterium]
MFSRLMEREEILRRLREIAGRVAESEGLELVDVELHGRGPGAVVRIYLDKEGGVTLEDCQGISRQVGAILDVEDLMAARYTLEVASPGLDRKLMKPSDFDRFTGRKVKFQLKAPKAGRRRFPAVLEGWESGQLRVKLESGEVIRVELEEIEKANLIPEFRDRSGAGSGAVKAPSR